MRYSIDPSLVAGWSIDWNNDLRFSVTPIFWICGRETCVYRATSALDQRCETIHRRFTFWLIKLFPKWILSILWTIKQLNKELNVRVPKSSVDSVVVISTAPLVLLHQLSSLNKQVYLKYIFARMSIAHWGWEELITTVISASYHPSTLPIPSLSLFPCAASPFPSFIEMQASGMREEGYSMCTLALSI